MNDHPSPPEADLRRELRRLASALELACQIRCGHHGRDDTCHRPTGCRNRRRRDGRFVCVQDAAELRR